MASDRGGPDLVAVVTVTRRKGRDFVDSEIHVGTLEELYEACRKAAPAELMKVALRGPLGEVRLNFGSYIEHRRR